MRPSCPRTLTVLTLALTLTVSSPSPAHALAPVTIQPLEADCSAFPGYNATTQTAGPWPVVADSTGSAIDGSEASIVSFTNDGTDRYGFLTVPLPNATIGAPSPRTTLRCASSTLQAQLGPAWVPLAIAADENWQRALAFGLPGAPELRVQPYAHVGGGTRAAGVYLGAAGSTTWFFKHNWGGNAGEYFLVRWVEGGLGRRQAGGEPPVVDDRDWVGHLRIVG